MWMQMKPLRQWPPWSYRNFISEKWKLWSKWCWWQRGRWDSWLLHLVRQYEVLKLSEDTSVPTKWQSQFEETWTPGERERWSSFMTPDQLSINLLSVILLSYLPGVWACSCFYNYMLFSFQICWQKIGIVECVVQRHNNVVYISGFFSCHMKYIQEHN